MSTRKAALCLFLLCSLSPLRAAGESDRSRLDFWKENYSELRPADDPRVARAHEIFDRVVSAAGNRAGVVPRLFIVKDAGACVPLAIALPDGGIVISKQVLDICYKEPGNGDDRLAFILAHEIAHQLKDDFWHLKFFHAVELSQREGTADAAAIEEVKEIAGKSNEPLLKELQCDEYGIVYASMAGFDTKAIVFGDGAVNFFTYFAASLDPGNIKGAARDASHPTPEARAAAVEARLTQVLDVVDLFDLGVMFYQTGDYEKASSFFAEFLQSYPGREVYHDLATCSHQLARESYREWKGPENDYPFKLALTIESETRARKIRLRGDAPPDFAAEFKERIGKAVELYRTALGQDPAYWPSGNNLGCALLLEENAYEAVAVLQKALKSAPDSPLVLNNLGVAFYRAENASKAKECLRGALKISADYEPALYNLGVIAAKENGAAENLSSGPAPSPEKAPQAENASPVEPASPEAGKENVTGVATRDYDDAVPAAWGAPVDKRSFLGTEDPVILTVFGNGVRVVAQRGKIVRLAVASPFAGATAKGIALGASRKDLVNRYGKPSAVFLLGGGEAWKYDAPKVTFTIRDGKVTSWTLF